jgi:hypothetical protein
MIPVIANTNIDKLKIDFAGVDSGAKILVRPVDEESAAAAAVAMQQNKNTTDRKAVRTIMFFRRCISVPRAFSKCAGPKLMSRSQPLAICLVGNANTSRD